MVLVVVTDGDCRGGSMVVCMAVGFKTMRWR
jgi:hypothetical protein